MSIMVGITSLCLLLVFCAANANPLDSLKNGVKKSKNQVQTNIEQLERLRTKAILDTIRKTKDDCMEQMRRYNDYSDRTLDEIRNKVEAAKAEGKNAQPCYDTASDTLRNIWNTASNDAQRCVDTAESSIKSELGFIDNLITTGRKLIVELDGIFPNCFRTAGNNIIEMQSCITLKLATVNIVVRDLQSKANSAKRTVDSASNNIVLQGHSCVYNIYSATFSQMTEVRLAATKCLEAL